MENNVIKVADNDKYRSVKVLMPQKSQHQDKAFDTYWPSDLLYKLADLKGEWFNDSYARFENRNDMRKHYRMMVEWYKLNLSGKKILDFGCGFGASIHALISEGATNVIGTDLVPENMGFANTMIKAFGYEKKSTVFQGSNNWNEVAERGPFDIVNFQAVLEHLTPNERQEYIRALWGMIKPGGMFVMTETPNRLWPKEVHTSGTWLIPYFKDQNIFKYMRKKQMYGSWSDEQFYRSGIVGVTYGQIIKWINDPNCIELTVNQPHYLKTLYSLSNKSAMRTAIISLADKLEPILTGLSNRPVTAYMPFLNHMIFQKVY